MTAPRGHIKRAHPTRLSQNTQEQTNLLVAKIYLDSFTRSAGDSAFMAKLIQGEGHSETIPTTRPEQISALIKFFASTGALCDLKLYALGYNPLDANLGAQQNLCSPNVDVNRINELIDQYIKYINNNLESTQATIGRLNNGTTPPTSITIPQDTIKPPPSLIAPVR